MAVTTVQIGDKVLTISGDQGSEDLVMTAGDVVNKYFNVASEKADVVEAVLPAAHTAEEEIENSGDIYGYMAAEVTETVTEAALPAPASSEASGDVTEMVTEAEDRSGPALATEPKKTRGKGPKKAAEGEPKENLSYGFCGGQERGRSARTGCA